ncbi:DUF4294 domain-containing protein [Sunxiuqinia sp. A32]|uniref:DUF4294 domain-containing protein n=1 Tax=Sunxiuqinia sp. A32 TaxID=3461496 RepID=UPI004045DCF5
MKKLFIYIMLALLGSIEAHSQILDSLNILEGIQQDGDTLPHQTIGAVVVYPKRDFKNTRQERRYWRLAAKVKKVYPYAKKAGELLDKYEADYEAANSPKEKRRYVKQAEKELFDEYGPQLKKLTLSEGRILIKLIDRQTGHTSYDLIKDLKGGLSAFFWQSVARIFGNDLKDDYDPVAEDRIIEEIIFYIEAGIM